MMIHGAKGFFKNGVLALKRDLINMKTIEIDGVDYSITKKEESVFNKGVWNYYLEKS